MAGACVIEETLADLTDQTTWSMRDEDAREAVLLLTQLEAQVAELSRRVLAEADRRDVAADTGGTSMANWLAHTTKLTRTESNRRVKQAKALDTREQTRCALATGDLHLEQATVITHAVDSLPTDKCPPETVALVEKTLIENASEFDAKTLKILGWRVWEVLDPEGAEAYEAEQPAKEEDAAGNQTKLTMHDDGTGAVRGRFVIPSAQGAMFKKLLLSFAAPKHRAAKEAVDGTGFRDGRGRPPQPTESVESAERAATPKRMGEAFCELIESFRSETDHSKTAVLCPRHHTLIHHHDYAHEIKPDDTITFHRRI